MRHASFRCTSFKNRQDKRPARHPVRFVPRRGTDGPIHQTGPQVCRISFHTHGMGDGVRSVSARYIDLSGVNTWHGT